MARHVFVAGIVAVLSLGLVTFSLDASARPGGLGGPGAGRAGGGHIGFHRGGGRPFAHGRHIHRHGAHRFGRHGVHRGKFARDLDKRDIGLSLPFGAAGYIDGSTQVPYYGGFSAPGAAVSGGAMSGGGVFYRHVCRSDVQTVPSGRGGETDVTVTRCYYVVAD